MGDTSQIWIEYSEDFWESRKAARTYKILRDHGLDPLRIKTNYKVGEGIGFTVYSFPGDVELPSQEALEEMLSDVDLTSIWSI